MVLFNTKVSFKVLELPFVNQDGIRFDQRVKLDIFDEYGKIVDSKDYGYLPIEDVYDLIEQQKSINLNQCFIYNFSLTAYKRMREMKKTSLIHLYDFSAKDAVFYSNFVTDFSNTWFEGEQADFSGTYFAHGNVSFYNSEFYVNSVKFNSVMFRTEFLDFSGIKVRKGNFEFKNNQCSKGEITFQHAQFMDGRHSFANTIFGDGDFKFSDVNFKQGKVSFKISQFGTGVKDFRLTSFGDCFVDFEWVEFGDGDVFFRRVNFGAGKTNFNRASFGHGNVSFHESIKKVTSDGEEKFHDNSQLGKRKTALKMRKTFLMKFVSFGSGNFNFERVQMPEVSVSFYKATFDRGSRSRISFNRSSFKKLSFRSCHLDDYIDLRLESCQYIDLSNTVVRDVIDLKSYDFDVKINILDISHMRLLGRIDIDWHRSKVEDMILHQKHNDNWLYADQFRLLKENFNNTGRYLDEDKAYVLFKRHEEKALFEDAVAERPESILWQRPMYYSRVLIFDWIGLYATDPIRVLISVVVSTILFGFLYTILILSSAEAVISGINPDGGFFTTILEGIYFSAVTFLTIGFGDMTPATGFTSFLAAFEGFVGVFLMSYFTVAFVRKILR